MAVRSVRPARPLHGRHPVRGAARRTEPYGWVAGFPARGPAPVVPE
jgi:hypothetical protein